MGGLVQRVLYTEHMNFEFEMVSFPRCQIDQMLIEMQRAETICRNAQNPSRHPDKEELMREPSFFYSGASGHAGVCLRNVIQQIESQLPLK